jgi:hypothetical protein
MTDPTPAAPQGELRSMAEDVLRQEGEDHAYRAAPQGEDRAAYALGLAIEALEWHYAKNYLDELTDIPRKRDAKALRECKAALTAERVKSAAE